jgi:hypothetical protein
MKTSGTVAMTHGTSLDAIPLLLDECTESRGDLSLAQLLDLDL